MNPIQKIKILFKSKDAKVLLENFISLSTLELVGLVLPLITLPYVLRILDFEKYGIVILSLSLVAYFQSLTDYSFRITATRDVAIFKSNPVKLNIIYSKVIIVKSLFLILSLCILTTIILIYPPFYKERSVFFVSASMLLGHALFPEWFFQGIEKMKYITLLNLSIKVLFTIAIFLFIKEQTDYLIYALLQSAGVIGAGIAGQIILLKKFKLKILRIKPKTIKQTIIENFPIFINQFFPTLYNNTSTFLLGIFAPTNLVGIYAAIKKVIDIAIMVLKILSRVFYPLINRRKNIFNSYKNIMLGTGLLFTFLILIFHKLFFLYLNLDYTSSFLVLILLSIGIIGVALYDIFGLNYFIVRRQDKLVMRNTIMSSLIGFFMAFPLIYYFGIIGAAINLSIARWLMGGGLFFHYKKALRYDN